MVEEGDLPFQLLIHCISSANVRWGVKNVPIKEGTVKMIILLLELSSICVNNFGGSRVLSSGERYLIAA